MQIKAVAMKWFAKYMRKSKEKAKTNLQEKYNFAK